MARILLLFLSVMTGLHAADRRIADGLNRFGIDCYRQVEKGTGNVILSPFSISTALSMTLAGAHGQTASDIAALLHQPYPDPQYAVALAALSGQLAGRANGGGNELLSANALWVQSGFRLEPDFRRTMEGPYAAPLTPLDFVRNLDSARAAINSWTDRQTKGRIHELFPAGSLDARVRLVLTSAVYFYGKWERPFGLETTRSEPFKLGGGRTVDARFMNQTASFAYGETPTLQILEMRYAGTGLAWDVLLPKTDNGLADLEKSLTADNLATWLGGLSARRVEVVFPKFRAESGFSLRETLSRMGMGSAFANADFSGINGRRDLALADVVHKAFVNVSEEGTEAAAATGATAVRVSAIIPEHKVFRADHPFLFFIRDTQTGWILFAGRLANPVG